MGSHPRPRPWKSTSSSPEPGTRPGRGSADAAKLRSGAGRGVWAAQGVTGHHGRRPSGRRANPGRRREGRGRVAGTQLMARAQEPRNGVGGGRHLTPERPRVFPRSLRKGHGPAAPSRQLRETHDGCCFQPLNSCPAAAGTKQFPSNPPSVRSRRQSWGRGGRAQPTATAAEPRPVGLKERKESPGATERGSTQVSPEAGQRDAQGRAFQLREQSLQGYSSEARGASGLRQVLVRRELGSWDVSSRGWHP